MAESAARPAGSIYDLGYRRYEGERLGRRHAIVSLFFYSVRSVFGIGRSWLNKLFPVGLAVLALTPAGIQLAIAAVSPRDVDIVKPQQFFAYVEIVVGLFVAAIAPEVVGRDQRNRTIPLYFSRALERVDYVSAKVLAVVVCIFGVLIVPQAVLFLGDAVATDKVLTYIGDNAGEIPPMLGTSAVIAVYFTAVSLAIASHTPNRALSTAMILGFLVVGTLVVQNLARSSTGDLQRYVLLLSPYDTLEGTVAWMFGVPPRDNSVLLEAGTATWLFFPCALVYSALGFAALYRRFLKLVA